MVSTITTTCHLDYDLEVILAQLVDSNGICRICGHDHSIIQPNTDLQAGTENITLEAV